MHFMNLTFCTLVNIHFQKYNRKGFLWQSKCLARTFHVATSSCHTLQNAMNVLLQVDILSTSQDGVQWTGAATCLQPMCI